jgi:hypothetical protein
MKSLALKLAAIALIFGGTSCMTTYDAYGRPVQTVDPGAAAAGIAAAGLVGYALGQDHHHHGYYGPYYGGYYGRPYCY